MEQDVLQTSLSFLKRMVFNKGVTCSYLDSLFSLTKTRHFYYASLTCIVNIWENLSLGDGEKQPDSNVS